MAFPASPSNNDVHKEGNRAFVWDSTLGVWDQVREADRSENKIVSGEIGASVTGGAGLVTTPSSHRNLIINGAMNVAQRGTASVSPHTGYTTADRWLGDGGSGITNTEASVQSLTLNLTTRTIEGEPYDLGFRKSLKYLTTTNTTNTGAYFSILTKVEAQDIANSGWNYTDPSSYITLSYWVKISPAGQYHSTVVTHDGTAMWYGKHWTADANTWTKVEMTMPGNSGLTVNNDTGPGLVIYPFTAYGTNYSNSNPAETWTTQISASQTLESSGLPTWLNTSGAYVEFTGVQLEVGSVATPFEHRTYGDELARCQRYYNRVNNIGNSVFLTLGRFSGASGGAYVNYQYPVSMRAAPQNYETSAAGTWYSATGYSSGVLTFVDLNSVDGCTFVTGAANVAANGILFHQGSGSGTAYMAFEKEL